MLTSDLRMVMLVPVMAPVVVVVVSKVAVTKMEAGETVVNVEIVDDVERMDVVPGVLHPSFATTFDARTLRINPSRVTIFRNLELKVVVAQKIDSEHLWPVSLLRTGSSSSWRGTVTNRCGKLSIVVPDE